jgi:phosphodiesterase/alkaline phosphatase D-like protein
MHKPPFPTELDTGLIVGAVTPRSGRVWVRGEGELRVGERVFAVRPTDDRTAVIDVKDLEPDTIYPLSFRDRRGVLRTLPEGTDRICFALVSCHLPFAEHNGSIVLDSSVAMLDALRAVIAERDARFVLHVGDQIYADPERLEALDLWKHTGEPLDLYHTAYRAYFGVPSLMELHATVPSFMIWDDGEIADTWGSITSDHPRTSEMFAAARSAYVSYQHSHNPPTDARDLHYAFDAGSASFFVLDLRGQRDHTQKTLLGARQWAAFEAWIARTEHRQPRFVVSSVPLLHTPDVLVERFTRPGTVASEVLPAAFHDRWSADAFHHELKRMLDLLLPRGIIVLSGDIHIGTANEIGDSEGRRVHQWVSSAITHRARVGNRLAAEIVSRLANIASPWKISAAFHELGNNFAIVEVINGRTTFDLYVLGENGPKALYQVSTESP